MPSWQEVNRLKTIGLTLALLLVAIPLVPAGSAAQCVGHGEPGATIATVCNTALDAAHDAAGDASDAANRAATLADHVVNCVLGPTSQAQVVVVCVS